MSLMILSARRVWKSWAVMALLTLGVVVWGSRVDERDGGLARLRRQTQTIQVEYHVGVMSNLALDPFTVSAWVPGLNKQGEAAAKDVAKHADGLKSQAIPDFSIASADDATHTITVVAHLNHTECERVLRTPVNGFVPVSVNDTPVSKSARCVNVFDNQVRLAAVLLPNPHDFLGRLRQGMFMAERQQWEAELLAHQTECRPKSGEEDRSPVQCDNDVN